MVQAQTLVERQIAVSTASDDHLIQRCQAGDQESFRWLVERYAGAVFGTALLMTGDRPLAEDLTQEAFIHAWRGLRGFRLGWPLKPWLLRIVVNRVSSHRRRRLLSMVPLPWAERAASHDLTPDATVEAQQERDEVGAAVARLPDEHRQLIVLRFYAELSVPEIARVTGLAEGTVKSRLHRALARLRELLTHDDVRRERGEHHE